MGEVGNVADLTNYDMERQIEEWLNDYNYMKAFIAELEDELSHKGEENMGIDTSNEPVSKTYKFNSTVENAVVSSEKTYEILKQNKITVKKIDAALAALNETEFKIVKNRCIDGKYYYQFTYEVGISERSCKRIKKGAIKNMRKAIFGM